MGKVAKILLWVMLILAILAGSLFLTPWIPVGDGLWSPLDVVMYDGSIEDFTEPIPTDLPAELPAEHPVEQSDEEPAEEQYGPAVIPYPES